MGRSKKQPGDYQRDTTVASRIDSRTLAMLALGWEALGKLPDPLTESKLISQSLELLTSHWVQTGLIPEVKYTDSANRIIMEVLKKVTYVTSKHMQNLQMDERCLPQQAPLASKMIAEQQSDKSLGEQALAVLRSHGPVSEQMLERVVSMGHKLTPEEEMRLATYRARADKKDMEDMKQAFKNPTPHPDEIVKGD